MAGKLGWNIFNALNCSGNGGWATKWEGPRCGAGDGRIRYSIRDLSDYDLSIDACLEVFHSLVSCLFTLVKCLTHYNK